MTNSSFCINFSSSYFFTVTGTTLRNQSALKHLGVGSSMPALRGQRLLKGLFRRKERNMHGEKMPFFMPLNQRGNCIRLKVSDLPTFLVRPLRLTTLNKLFSCFSYLNGMYVYDKADMKCSLHETSQRPWKYSLQEQKEEKKRCICSSCKKRSWAVFSQCRFEDKLFRVAGHLRESYQ